MIHAPPLNVFQDYAVTATGSWYHAIRTRQNYERIESRAYGCAAFARTCQLSSAFLFKEVLCFLRDHVGGQTIDLRDQGQAGPIAPSLAQYIQRLHLSGLRSSKLRVRRPQHYDNTFAGPIRGSSDSNLVSCPSMMIRVRTLFDCGHRTHVSRSSLVAKRVMSYWRAWCEVQ